MNNLVRDGWHHVSEESTWHFTRVFQGFLRLREFIFVLDGSDDGFSGPDELVEPTSDFEDFYNKDGRMCYIERVAELAEILRVEVFKNVHTTFESC